MCTSAAGSPGMPAASAPSDRRAGHHITVPIQVHVARGSQWRLLAAVHHDLEAVPRTVQQPETAATQPGTVRFHHGECRAHRHGRVEGIAAGRENFHAGTGSPADARWRWRRCAACLCRWDRDRKYTAVTTARPRAGAWYGQAAGAASPGLLLCHQCLVLQGQLLPAFEVIRIHRECTRPDRPRRIAMSRSDRHTRCTASGRFRRFQSPW